MNITDLLARHIDTADDHHRLTLVTTRQLRCWDCRHTIDLPIFAAQAPAPPPYTPPTGPVGDYTAGAARAREALAKVRQREDRT